MSKTGIRGRPLPALPTSDLASPSHQEMDSDKNQDDPDTNVEQFTNNGMDNPRQASPQSQQRGQPSAEGTDRVGCNAADLFENPMYAAGMSQQDRGAVCGLQGDIFQEAGATLVIRTLSDFTGQRFSGIKILGPEIAIS
uniref:Uncharacterized protein n=1 Tax=Branchiostoma floridae TaxID=7739 RepID=C3YZQ0_BRAFL|eukprot:XP_002598309.1 hypothetical protein BRAFLDRAFT_69662 [Branchiostoma floridae]